MPTRIKAVCAAIIAIVSISLIFCLQGCSMGELSVEDSPGKVKIEAKDGATATALSSIQVDEGYDCLEISSDVTAGSITVAFNDGSAGRVVMDPDKDRELIDVEPGTYEVTVLATNAEGTAQVQVVTVLDGDGTAGS